MDILLSAGDRGGQRRASNTLDLELQIFVSFLTWVVGTKDGPSVREMYALKHCVIPLTQSPCYCNTDNLPVESSPLPSLGRSPKSNKILCVIEGRIDISYHSNAVMREK